MDNINGMLAFVRAAQCHSFTAAGERLGISASAVGKSVARLESRLNVRLFNRSTRRISLTDEGLLFFERCQAIVSQMEEAEFELSRLSAQPRGKLRVGLPAIGYRMLLPYLSEFMQRYPEIELELDFSDRMVDIIAEGLDIAIRSGELTDSEMMSRTLGPFRFVIIGSPDYFARHPLPQTPADLNSTTVYAIAFLKMGSCRIGTSITTFRKAFPALFLLTILKVYCRPRYEGLG